MLTRGTIAAMVLLNNDFSSIVVAIEMGRLVFDNLKKVMIYLMPVRLLRCTSNRSHTSADRPVPTPNS